MLTIQSNIEDRIERFRKAWKELAADASFAEMTLADFIAATKPSLDEREQLALLELMQAAALARRDAADQTSREKVSLVVNAVRGNPAFGDDSPLYRALGYTAKSERRSGLTRRGSDSATASKVVPMAA